MSDKVSIYKKLLLARESMGAFAKDGRHQQGWKFFQGDKVLEQVGDALALHGIWFVPEQTAVEHEIVMIDNKSVETAWIDFDMKFIDADTGDMLVVKTHGSARDYGDKALFKAQTLAIKYLFLRMFLKGEGEDDPDTISTPPARQQSRAQKPAPPRAAATEPDAQPDDAHATTWTRTQSQTDDLTWTRDRARISKLVDWAQGTVWKPDDLNRPHAINRVANALGYTLAGGKHGDFNALCELIAEKYEGTPENAMRDIQMYEPKTPAKPEPTGTEG